MMFRTRDKNGVLFTASSTDNTQTITLEVIVVGVVLFFFFYSHPADLTFNLLSCSACRAKVLEVSKKCKAKIVKYYL